MQRLCYILVLFALLAGMGLTAAPVSAANTLPQANHEACRPDGLYRTPGVNTPYCLVYDNAGREKMGSDHPRRIIGYFTSWRHGYNGMPPYLAKDIPWSKLTHINYAFAWVDPSTNRISVGNVSDPTNPATGLTWPGVAGAEMDPTLPYNGHFNLLTKYKKQYPDVKTLISVGGWADSGGFYTMTVNANNTINQAGINTFADSAVAFIRAYGFDGVDIDYEYPTSMQDAGNPLDWQVANARRATLMRAYTVLMKTLREKLDAAGAQDGKYYLLTIAAPSSGYLLRGMEYFQVTPYLDYVNIMSYDLHGAWNEFVGPNAALYDDGKDAELIRWNYYSTSQYGQLGYLNTDWAYHYFRGGMPAGRINIGVPYYTRGWRDVNGGTNGLWGTAPQTSGCPTGLTACGKGAIGIDNLWHDTENGQEIPAGSNPMWHAKNLQNGILPGYLADYGLNPASNPAHQLTGTYTRYYDATMKAPWLWNNQKKVFLSIEDEQSIEAKAQYVVDKGIGGIMFWELAGDYAWYPSQNQYYIGSTLTTLMYDKFKTALPYGNSLAKRSMPAQELDIKIELHSFALGDNNYPINPKMKITNNSSLTIPGGAEFQFNYPTSAPNNMADQSGFGLTVLQSEHTGNNIGGLKGDFHLASFKLPTWQSIPPGGSVEIALVYYLPIAGPSNFTVTFGGQSYRFSSEYPRGGGTVATSTPGPSATFTATNTPVTPTQTNTPGPSPTFTRTPTRTNTPVAPTATNTQPATGCTAPTWSASAVYNNGNIVSWNYRQWRAKWWTTNEEPGTTGQWGVWEDLGLCSGNPTATHTPAGPTATFTRTPTPTNTPVGPTATLTRTPTHTAAPPTATNTPGTGIPAWAPNTAYAVNSLVTYGGQTYKCLQAHTSLTGWEPPNVPALWQLQP